MSEIPELVATHLPEISAHFAASATDSDQPTVGDVKHLVISALAPALPSSEERPPQADDYTDHLPASLEILTRLVNMHSYSISRPASLPSLLLLCAQHSPCTETEVTRPWSSTEHQLQASLLLAKLEQIYKPVAFLLVEQDRKLLAQILTLLQPSLEKFLSYPASVHSLVWLTSHIPHPHLGQVVAQLLPHVLNWVDCWISHYKIAGCQVLGHIIATCPSTELVWYGRADLLSDALKKLLHHTDTEVVKACEKPLVTVVGIKHEGTKPDTPGPADLFMKDLINSLELASDSKKKEIYSAMILRTVTMLGVGVARWVARLTQLIVSQLDFSPPASVFSLLDQLCLLCPGCVAREVPALLPALVKFVYKTSWKSTPTASETCAIHQASEISEAIQNTEISETGDKDQKSDESEMSLASVCLVQIATCDPRTARLLCHDLDSVSVNKKFDSVVHKFIVELAVM
eukprot:GFUD01042870.1.p1 GENE.GFUD01042870.1~~GFUD01042870.1.p1  ORF type:complete len:460 (-),score=144.80 GFUD01042870.1:24-1403(-)